MEKEKERKREEALQREREAVLREREAMLMVSYYIEKQQYQLMDLFWYCYVKGIGALNLG